MRALVPMDLRAVGFYTDLAVTPVPYTRQCMRGKCGPKLNMMAADLAG